MVFEKVAAAIVATKRIPRENIAPETSLADLGLDSLDALNLAYELEEEFRSKLSKNNFVNIHTVGQLVAALEKIRE